MNRLLTYLLLCLYMLANQPSVAQNESATAGRKSSERTAAEQISNSQLHRIKQLLQQHQNAGYPDTKRIQQDLVGHSLAEGVTNGYRPDNWSWTIEEGQISRFYIVQTLEKTKNEYLIIAQMRLSNGYYAYDAKVKIKYVHTTKNSWEMDYAVSQGMYIVVTHEYDGYVRSAIVDDGWGGTYCVQFKNQSEMSLVAGGDYLTYSGWKRFTVVLPPHGSATVGGTFYGGSVSDYRVNFIVRIN